MEKNDQEWIEKSMKWEGLTTRNRQSGRRIFIRRLLVTLFLLLFFCGLLVYLVDPFFHYHKPWFHLKEVLNEKEYQCPGSLTHFDYDAVLAGSSVVENNDNSWFNQDFHCTVIKAVRSYGATADLCDLLDRAFRHRRVKQVFYNLDPSALHAEPVLTFASSGAPMYLYDNNPFNDVQYLWNKDVILKRIPYMIANSYLVPYDENLSYNWMEGKTFGEAAVLSRYYRIPDAEVKFSTDKKPVQKPENCYQDELRGNIALLEQELSAHPDTEFRIFIPPYSMLWWDNMNRSGELDSTFYEEREAVHALLSHPNVKLYLLQNIPEIITNLDNYMDTIHFSMEINHRIEQELLSDRYLVTKEKEEQVMEHLEAEIREILDTKVRELEEQNAFLYDVGGRD